MKLIFLEAVQNFGGARISTLEIASRLSLEHEVLVVDFYGSCEPFVKSVNNLNLNLEIVDKRDEPFIIKSSLSPFANLINLIRFIPHWFILRKKILRIIEKFDADYILVNNYKTLSILYGIKQKKFDVLFFARGWFTPQQISSTKKFLLKSIADKYVCVAEATRHALYCGKFAELKNLFVVHNAIDEKKLTLGVKDLKSDENETIILHAAGFLPEKGQLVSIEVARMLKAKGFKFKIVLAGLVYKGDRSLKFYKKIEQIIKEESLSDHIVIVKNETDIIPYFRGADIVIHPSETEGLPRVVMEAMCLKKPVIANAVGGVNDFILNEYTGFITDFNNAEDYYSYITLLINKPELYKYISSNAYELISTCFTADNQMKSFNKLLN